MVVLCINNKAQLYCDRLIRVARIASIDPLWPVKVVRLGEIVVVGVKTSAVCREQYPMTNVITVPAAARVVTAFYARPHDRPMWRGEIGCFHRGGPNGAAHSQDKGYPHDGPGH